MGGMAPPQVIISQPQPAPQQDNSLLSSFITSRMLNESNSRTNMTNIEPSYFNARESIIPKIPDTPLKQEIIREINPSSKILDTPLKEEITPKKIPKAPPLPPGKLTGMAAVNAELIYLASDEGKAEKARKKAETAAKKEAQKLEKETAPL
jgi:hypothetical protein